jgi:hypothetical protein
MKPLRIADSVRAMDADLEGFVGSVRSMQKSIAQGDRTLETGQLFSAEFDRELTGIHQTARGLHDALPDPPSESPLRNGILYASEQRQSKHISHSTRREIR